MNDMMTQKEFWDKEAENFDSIYSHTKSRLGNFFDRVFRWDMYERYRYAIENSEPIQGRSFLDVGCGSGRYSLDFARRNARRVVGIDVSQKMIQICRQKAADEGLNDRAVFLQTDLIGYDSKEKFDICVGIGLFDYISDPLPVLRKMRESTTYKVILSFPRFWTWRTPLRKIRLALKGCHVYFYTKQRIHDLLNRSGFKGYALRKIGQLYCVTAFTP